MLFNLFFSYRKFKQPKKYFSNIFNVLDKFSDSSNYKKASAPTILAYIACTASIVRRQIDENTTTGYVDQDLSDDLNTSAKEE